MKINTIEYEASSLDLFHQKKKFKEGIDNLRSEIKEIRELKKKLSVHLANTSKYITRVNKCYNVVENNTMRCLHSMHKNQVYVSKLDHALNIEKQLRKQAEEENTMLIYQVEQLQDESVQNQIEIDNLSFSEQELKKRISNVDESNLESLRGDSRKLDHIKQLVDDGTIHKCYSELKKHIQSLNEILQKPDDNNCCIVCRVNTKTMVFAPCGHRCVCEDCSNMIENNCPYCMVSIENRCKLYDV
tara:strand:- start:6776 stop:7507 length:732 start_codon:yes stop_codon:yes gene_type:complete